MSDMYRLSDMDGLWNIRPEKLCAGILRDWFQSRNPVYLIRLNQPENITNRISLIHSRVDRRSRSDSDWVLQTKNFVAEHCRGNQILVSSIGMLHYDFVLFLWTRAGGRSLVVSEFLSPFSARVAPQYQWFFSNPAISWICLKNPVRPHRSSAQMKQIRDIAVVSLTQRLIPGYIRKNGRMESLIARYARAGGKVGRSPGGSDSGGKNRMEDALIVKKESKITSCNIPAGYLWHFTRGRCSPWIDTGWEYYLAGLAGFGQPVPYSALDSLLRILGMRRVFGTSALIHGGFRVVSLTEADPADILSLCAWQPHLHRERFAPYAIGFPREFVLESGGKKVIYGDKRLFRELPAARKWLYQYHGGLRNNWRVEMEWRVRGELDFSRFPERKIRILVPTGVDCSKVLQAVPKACVQVVRPE